MFIVFCDLTPFIMSPKYCLRSVDGSKQIISFIFICEVAESNSFVMSVRLTWTATEQVCIKFYI